VVKNKGESILAGEVGRVRDPIRKGMGVALLTLLPFVMLRPARAQVDPRTFNGANTITLIHICSGSLAGLGLHITAICAGAKGNIQNLDVSGAGIITATPLSTTQRQQSKEEEIAEAEARGSGGSADSQVFRLANNLNRFVATGGDSVTHRTDGFEEGYHGADGSVVVGLGAHPASWLTYGVGFNYRTLHGSFDDRLGGFHVTTYRPFLFASFAPFDGAFIDTEIGYARMSNTRNRGPIAALQPIGTILARGIVTGTPGENAYEGSILAGYDWRLGRLSLGPRIGLNAGHFAVDGYTEAGQTGLELRYGSVDQNSLQSVIGAAANIVIATDFAIVLPGITASWVHEFEAYQRLIHAQFVEAPGVPFTFYSEKPASDFGVLGVHVTAVLSNRLRAFADFSRVVGNGRYESYGGTLGVAYAF
jgi:uncharacterized protein YhjY with autotransporter beta-barrel domain